MLTRRATARTRAEQADMVTRLPADVLARVGALIGPEDALCVRASCRAFAHALPAPTRTPRSAMMRSRALAAWAWALPGFRSAAFPAREQIELCALAARAGCVGTMALLREHGCKWDSSTCYGAARGRRLAVLQWAREHGCEWSNSTCSSAAEC